MRTSGPAARTLSIIAGHSTQNPLPSPSTHQGPGLSDSAAFAAASLKSESARALAFLAVLTLTVVMVVPRTMMNSETRAPILIATIGVAVLIAVQVATLIYAFNLRRSNRALPTWYSVSTVVIESLIPGVIILVQIMAGTLRPHAALNAPPVLAYGLVFVLTTLRLRPALSLLAAVLASVSYALLVFYTVYALGIDKPTTGLPSETYFVTPVLIFFNGLAAAWVARQIRRHVDAALHEAEMRRHVARIEKDLETARSIQRALLPRSSPDIDGFDIAGWNRPADQTGGDYYDWQKLPDGRWLVSLADVSGHGIGPALVTAACRAYLRASSLYEGDLAALTGRVNTLLADDLPEGRFVTLVSVILTPDTPSVPTGVPLGLLSAGHGPLLLWVHASGRVDDINPGDLPLAVVHDMSFGPQQTVKLEPGDALALITDGFFEWSKPADGSEGHDPDGTPRREAYGLDRLRDSLRKHAHLTAAQIVEALAADVTRFASGEPQQDDLTVVIIKKTNHPSARS